MFNRCNRGGLKWKSQEPTNFLKQPKASLWEDSLRIFKKNRMWFIRPASHPLHLFPGGSLSPSGFVGRCEACVWTRGTESPNAQNSSNQLPLQPGSKDCNIPWLRPPVAKAKDKVAKVCWCTGFTSCHVETTNATNLGEQYVWYSAKEPSVLATFSTTKYSWYDSGEIEEIFAVPKSPESFHGRAW